MAIQLKVRNYYQAYLTIQKQLNLLKNQLENYRRLFKAKEQKLNTELDQLHSQRSIDMDSRFQCKLHANELIYILQVS